METLPDLSAAAAAVLLLSAIVTAGLTTAFGAGGGVLLLAVMTLVLPLATALPLHGAVQAGANGLRTAILARHVRWPLLLAFAAGALPGTWAGSYLLGAVDEPQLQLLLGGFILWACWRPVPRFGGGSRLRVGAGGALTSAMTLFVGATGPLVAAFLRSLHLPPVAHMGTFSACMLLQHGLKLAAFGALGFAFGPWLPLLAAMLVCSLIGTALGRLLLGRLDDRWFHRLLGVLLTLLAVRLLLQGLAGMF